MDITNDISYVNMLKNNTLLYRVVILLNDNNNNIDDNINYLKIFVNKRHTKPSFDEFQNTWYVHEEFLDAVINCFNSVPIYVYGTAAQQELFKNKKDIVFNIIPKKEVNKNTKRGYYVMAYIRNRDDLSSLNACIESITKLDAASSIIVVNDNSPVKFELNNDKIKVIKNTYYPRCGEIFPYWYNTQNRIYDTFAVIHDSMILKRKIPEYAWNTTKCTFFWYFDAVQHTEQVSHNMNVLCGNIKNGDIILNKYMFNRDHWVGCFGMSAIINQVFLDSIYHKYDFDNLIKHINTRPMRETCERILGIILCLELGKNVMKKHSLNKSIFKHPNCFCYDYKLINNSLDSILNTYKKYDSYIIKTWKGR
jgi:hypothetical protein